MDKASAPETPRPTLTDRRDGTVPLFDVRGSSLLGQQSSSYVAARPTTHVGRGIDLTGYTSEEDL